MEMIYPFLIPMVLYVLLVTASMAYVISNRSLIPLAPSLQARSLRLSSLIGLLSTILFVCITILQAMYISGDVPSYICFFRGLMVGAGGPVISSCLAIRFVYLLRLHDLHRVWWRRDQEGLHRYIKVENMSGELKTNPLAFASFKRTRTEQDEKDPEVHWDELSKLDNTNSPDEVPFPDVPMAKTQSKVVLEPGASDYGVAMAKFSDFPVPLSSSQGQAESSKMAGARAHRLSSLTGERQRSRSNSEGKSDGHPDRLKGLIKYGGMPVRFTEQKFNSDIELDEIQENNAQAIKAQLLQERLMRARTPDPKHIQQPGPASFSNRLMGTTMSGAASSFQFGVPTSFFASNPSSRRGSIHSLEDVEESGFTETRASTADTLSTIALERVKEPCFYRYGSYLSDSFLAVMLIATIFLYAAIFIIFYTVEQRPMSKPSNGPVDLTAMCTTLTQQVFNEVVLAIYFLGVFPFLLWHMDRISDTLGRASELFKLFILLAVCVIVQVALSVFTIAVAPTSSFTANLGIIITAFVFQIYLCVDLTIMFVIPAIRMHTWILTQRWRRSQRNLESTESGSTSQRHRLNQFSRRAFQSMLDNVAHFETFKYYMVTQCNTGLVLLYQNTHQAIEVLESLTGTAHVSTPGSTHNPEDYYVSLQHIYQLHLSSKAPLRVPVLHMPLANIVEANPLSLEGLPTSYTLGELLIKHCRPPSSHSDPVHSNWNPLRARRVLVTIKQVAHSVLYNQHYSDFVKWRHSRAHTRSKRSRSDPPMAEIL